MVAEMLGVKGTTFKYYQQPLRLSHDQQEVHEESC